MADCCEDKSCALEALRTRQSATLKTVLWINAAMFIAVSAAGIYASSSALLADSLDNLGDALTYALSLYAVGRGTRAKGLVSLVKGALILGAALFVLAAITSAVVRLARRRPDSCARSADQVRCTRRPDLFSRRPPACAMAVAQLRPQPS